MADVNTILNDQTVIAITVSIMSLLGTGLIAALIYIYKKGMGEVKEMRLERSAFTEALTEKFTALNEFVAIHKEKIKDLNEDTNELKKKSDSHGLMLAEHKTEIGNLKSRLRNQ